MHKVVIALVASMFAFGAAGAAGAGTCDELEGMHRQFTGKLDKIDKKKGRIYVDNRKGDKVQFHKTDTTVVGTEVADLERPDFDALKKEDWVTVYWKFTDKPRKAYCIDVLPPREE